MAQKKSSQTMVYHLVHPMGCAHPSWESSSLDCMQEIIIPSNSVPVFSHSNKIS